jgi:hypothetical protein
MTNRTSQPVFTVESGVHGATRINTREYPTLAEAEAAARRWSESNSQGHYWAEVTSYSLAGSVGFAPGKKIVHARFNLPGDAIRPPKFGREGRAI